MIRPTFNPVSNGFSIALMVFVALVTPALQERLLIWRMKRLDHAKELQPFEILLDEEGLHFRRKESERDIPWQEVKRISADGLRYFVYHDERAAIILPKQEIDREQDFVALVKKFLPKEKVSLVPVVRPKRKTLIILVTIATIVLFGIQYFSFSQDERVKTATGKVSELFIQEKEDAVKEEESSRIKPTTNQQQINEAMRAVQRIHGSNKLGEHELAKRALEMSLLVAQHQLDEREGKTAEPDGKSGEHQEEKSYTPEKEDVRYEDGELKNKELLESFIDDATKQKDGAIRVVKDMYTEGTLILTLEAKHDQDAGVGWVDVDFDRSHYHPEGQDVFSKQSQQCGEILKSEEEGFYQLRECNTHWQYNLLPTEAYAEEHERIMSK